MDRERTRLAAGLALSAASAAVFLITTSLGLLIAARVLSGLAAGLTSGTATSAMIGLGGTDRRARSAAIAPALPAVASGVEDSRRSRWRRLRGQRPGRHRSHRSSDPPA